jgi:signal peptidase II
MFDHADQINIIISILAAVVALVIIIIYPRIDRKERALRIAILLQLGGTIGNLISRIQFGYVLDFISVGNFAVFNIADSSLVVGASLMVLAVLIEEIQEVRTKRELDSVAEEMEQTRDSDSENLINDDLAD